MLDKLKQLEAAARLLEPDAAHRDHLLNQVIAYGNQYLQAIPDMPAYQHRSDNGDALYQSAIGETGIDIAEALALLQNNVNTVGLNPTSGRFLGYIPGGALYHSALADYLAAITNRYVGIFFANPGAVKMENMLIRWMAGVVGYPETAAGSLLSGGSVATLTAVVAARDAAGVVDAAVPKNVVYLTSHVHHCVDKSLRVAGVGHCVKRIIPVDQGYRMQAEALEQAIGADKEAGLTPWLVVASAGTTNSGAVDPLSDIGQIAAAHRLWFHVDGAYGGFFVLCPEGKAILQGLDGADSMVMDPHKTLFLPYGTGAVLVKDRQKLYASYSAEADYMQNILDEDGELSAADLSPELTRHFRGLRLWLPLKLLGVAPFRAALSEKIHLARYFHRQVQAMPGFEVGPYPDLSIVIYRYVPPRGDANAFNHRLMRAIQRDGRVFLSSTRLNGQVVLRMAISSFRTHLDDVDLTLNILRETAANLAAE